METRPITKREERWFSRRAVRRYSHVIGLNCNSMYGIRCLRCLWWSLTGEHRRDGERRAKKRLERRASTPLIRREGDGFVVLSESEALAAARSTLARAGYTYPELAAQAAMHRFDNVAAQLAWMAVRHIGDPDKASKP